MGVHPIPLFTTVMVAYVFAMLEVIPLTFLSMRRLPTLPGSVCA
ncbi:MAG: hypothetical protein ACRDRI_07995 [Pseudonocardiaceae bacterium]